MKFLKKDLNLESGITKEWIITNGIGGYSSSTIVGANTRKYHGLLVASLAPPAKRFIVLSKVDESIEVEGKNYPLYTNICKNHISEGYKNIETFEKIYMPKYTYKVKDTIVEKNICMEYGKNTVVILYKVKNGKSKSIMTFAPIVNFRDFHTMSTNCEFVLNQDITDRKVKIEINKNKEKPLYMNMSEGKYIEHTDDIFKDMFYIEEEKRGFFPEENHSVVGRYEVELNPNEEKEISFVFSLEEDVEKIDANKVIKNEIKRLDKIVKDTKLLNKKTTKKELTKKEIEENELFKKYIIATDNFVVYRPEFKLHTIIAGYPWFLDWGRDTLISFEGLLLITKRYDIAKEVLLTITKDVNNGLVPNGYSEFDNTPLYNSADSSLLLFEQVSKYLKYTKDYKFIKENIYDILVEIIDSYITGIDLDNNNIYLDKDNLLVSGTEETQNTWMDAKIGNLIVTPRNGKAVEINSLWYNALKILEELSIEFKKKRMANKYSKLAEDCKESFKKAFYNKEKKCLYDVIGDDKIRPNQLFSISLTYQVLDAGSKQSKEIFDTVNKKLLNKYGLKTLAKGEKDYIDIYEGDSFRRDMSYHQGITWPWLLGIYNDAFKNIIENEKTVKGKKDLKEKYDKFILNTYTTFKKDILKEGCIGSISELFDSKTPYRPKGAMVQAWSVAEIFRIIIGDKS